MRWLAILFVLVLSYGCGKRAAIEHHDASAVVSVIAALPGATPPMIESELANPLEDALAHVAGLAHLRTRIVTGVVTIVAELEAGTDPAAASQDIRGALGRIVATLPSEAEPPIVTLAEPNDRAVLRYTLHGDLPATAISRWQHEVASRALERLSGVGRVVACGEVATQWSVAIDPAALAARGVGVNTVITALERSAIDAPHPIADRLAADPVLRAVATVAETTAPSRCRAVDRRGPALVVSVIAQRGTDPLAVRETLETQLHELVLGLPPGLHLEILPRTRPIAFAIGEVTPASLDHVRTILASIPGAGAFVVELGANDPTTAEVRLVPSDPDAEATVESAARTAAAAAHLTVRDRSQVIVKITGPELDQLRRSAEAVASAFPGRVTERLGFDDAPQLEAELDHARLADLGISAADVASVLEVATDDGRRIAGPIDGPPVVLALRSTSTGIDRMRLLTITSRAAGVVTLDQLVRWTSVAVPTVILHDDRQRWVGVRVAATPEEIRAAIDNRAIPPGYRLTLAAPD